MRKGQTSIEFMFLVGFMFIIFMSFLVVISLRMDEAKAAKDVQDIKETTNILAAEIRNAQLFDQGYKRAFRLPITINGKSYNITMLDQQEIIVTMSGQEYLSFLDNATVGSLNPGENTICTKVHPSFPSMHQIHLNNCTDV
ncbi:MAG: hypothetical protein ABIH41_03475 [Nanoarchaeota archaeon]